MANFFNSEAANYLVSIAAKVSKTEKKITQDRDSEALVILYNRIEEATRLISESVEQYEKDRNR